MKNILLVDDDKISNFVNAKLLERTGLIKNVHTAWNGKEALDLFNDYFQRIKTLPDIILLDLCMPVMDGFHFLEVFRKLRIPGTEEVRVVIISASADANDIEKAKQLGAIAFLIKPLDYDLLVEIIAKTITP